MKVKEKGVARANWEVLSKRTKKVLKKLAKNGTVRWEGDDSPQAAKLNEEIHSVIAVSTDFVFLRVQASGLVEMKPTGGAGFFVLVDLELVKKVKMK